MPEPEVGDEDFLDVARTPAKARALRNSLRRLADSEDGALREMAREVLAGRLGLRQALRTGAYREALQERAQSGMYAYDAMSSEERRAAEAEGRRQLDAYQEEIDRERSERQLRRGGEGKGAGPARHEGRGWRL